MWSGIFPYLSEDFIEESEEALLVVFGVEPGRMIEEIERCPVSFVVTVEVLHEDLVHTVGVRRIRTSVAHRATSPSEVDPHDHTDLPDTGKASARTGSYHALVGHGVVEGVRPVRWVVLEYRHR